MTDLRRIAVSLDLDQPYKQHTDTFVGIHDYANQCGNWRLILDDWADHRIPTNASKPCPFDGFIGRITALGAQRAKRLNLPVVNMHYSSPAKGIAGVFPDFAECGRLRAEHLLSRGFRKFGVYYHENDQASIKQVETFTETVQEAGCEVGSVLMIPRTPAARMGVNELGVYPSYKVWQGVVQSIDRWMDSWELPIGIYIDADSLARTVIEQCTARGWSVPEDVAIIVATNEEGICERPAPSLTTMEMPYENVGYQAARLLDRQIDQRERGTKREKGQEVTAPQTILLPPIGILARASTDYQAVDDPLVRQAYRYMNNHLHRPILVDDIADAVGVSRRTLADRFSATLNRGIAAELKRLRLERAKRELIGTNKTIPRIASIAGFSSERTLHTVFRKELGCTPGTFRKRANFAKLENKSNLPNRPESDDEA